MSYFAKSIPLLVNHESIFYRSLRYYYYNLEDMITVSENINLILSVLGDKNLHIKIVEYFVYCIRGGSRGGQSGHATHVKNAQVINIQS